MNETGSEILVVGGGLVGLSVAYALLRQGHRVTILEKERLGARASWAAAGMLQCRPWPRKPGAPPDYHDLVIESIKLHESWAKELWEETEIDVKFRRTGSLELFAKTSDPKEIENRERHLEGCRERLVRAEPVTIEEARRLEPNLAEGIWAGGILFPDEAQVRPPRLLKALALACRQREAKVFEGVEVVDLIGSHGRVEGVLSQDGRRWTASRVCLCLGAWTGQFAPLTTRLKRAGKIKPIRGQILLYQADPCLATRFLTAGHEYVVGRGDGNFLVGSTMEETGFEAVTTAEGCARLKEIAVAFLPALGKLEPQRSWADLRPGLKGAHPLLGAVPGLEGLFLAAGHFRNGICLAPVSGMILAALIAGQPSPFPWPCAAEGK